MRETFSPDSSKPWTKILHFPHGKPDAVSCSMLLGKQRLNPDRVLPAWTSPNILAGSDTTAILLRTIFKNLITHRESLKCLLDEIHEAQTVGRLSPIVSWKESRQLPYLDACIKEAGRLHPPFGLNLERVVPTGGLEIYGQHIPAGTIVGMNAWAVHRDRDVFGQDAHLWRPERWLEGDEENIKKMEASLLTVSTQYSNFTQSLFLLNADVCDIF